MPRHNIWGERRPGNAPRPAGPPLGPITGDAGRSPHVALTVFYNGECPVCRRYIARYQVASVGGSNLIAWSDAAAAPWALKRWHVEPAAAVLRLHVADADGRLFMGAAAFARLWRELPGYRLLGLLLALPGIARAAEGMYRIVHVWPQRRRRQHEATRRRWADLRAQHHNTCGCRLPPAVAVEALDADMPVSSRHGCCRPDHDRREWRTP